MPNPLTIRKTYNSFNYVTGTSTTLTGVLLDDFFDIVVKGDWTGASTAKTIDLTVAGSTRDTVGVKQAATADKLPWYLCFQYLAPSTANISVSVAASGGTLANVKIRILRF